jgi:hypothetical protein
MPDIRLTRRRGSQLWLWSGTLAVVGLLIWAYAAIFGDATDEDRRPAVGAMADFGAERAPVLPIEAVGFEALRPLSERDLGRLVRFSGTVERPVVRGVTWVRANDGRRILLRIEPLPPEDTRIPFSAGSRIEVAGYLQSISRAEFSAWMDSLRVSIPRPPPAPRLGTAPDPAFARIDALYVRNFYISIRPEQL